METQGRYALIGGFTLAGVLGILGFILWFASVEVDRQFDYYDVDFDSVAGLSAASIVRFNGFPVGQVVSLGLAPDRSGKIRVRIEVDSQTPVRTSSLATVESQGVTGVSYVGLSAGRAEEPLLNTVSNEIVPVIPAGRSAIQTLTEDAPEIVEELLAVSQQLRQLFGEENQQRINAIIVNLEDSSANLGTALDDFSQVADTIADSSAEIADFTSRLDEISAAATEALNTGNTTLEQITELARRAETTLDIGDAALQSGRETLETVNTFVAGELPALVDNLTATTDRLGDQIDLVVADARATLDEFRTTGQIAAQRLTEAGATIEATDAVLAQVTDTMVAVEEASVEFKALVTGDGAAVITNLDGAVTEARALIATATDVAETDLPAIVADIRRATESAANTVDSVGADLSAAAGRVDGLSDQAELTLQAASDTLARANTTLTEFNTALEAGTSALAAAEETFGTVDTVVSQDVRVLIADLRATFDDFETALDAVADDIPALTGDLRETAERANAAIASIQSAVNASAPALRSFAEGGLPQYTRLAEEARGLVDTLDRLARNIERDPARYFFGGDEPQFRR